MIAAVSNPVSGLGSGAERLRFVQQVCAELDLELTEIHTTGPRDVVRAVKEAAAMSPEAVVIIGGDGSVGETCAAYNDLDAARRPPVVLAPSGRGNSFYKAVLFDAPWKDYVRRALTGWDVRAFDAARVAETGDVWALGFSLGYFHDTVDATRYFRGLRGRNLYAAAGIFAAARLRPFTVEVAVDGRAVYAGRSVLTAVAGGAFRGGRLVLFPAADLADGVLDVVVVEDVRPRRFAEVLRAAASGDHVDLPDVHVFQGAQIRLGSPDPMRAEMDGSPYPQASGGVTLNCLPGVLPLAYPRSDRDLIEPSVSGAAS